MKSFQKTCSLLVAVSVLSLGAARAESTNQADLLKELQQQIKALQEEVRDLKATQKSPPTAVAPAPTPTAAAETRPDAEAAGLLGQDFFKAKGLSLGFYGESKYRFPEAGADSFDAHRYVLTPSYEIADWLIFNSELELEHGGVDESTGRGSRFNGELEVEQFYVDILINEHFNIRSLGIDLVPVGRINKYHEPTTFYSTERPELYREIIPSTWMEPSLGFFGQITDTLDYQVMVSTGLEDFSSSAAGPGVTAASGMRNARPRLRAADESNLAYSGRLHFNGIEGLDASTSFYVAPAEGFNQQDVMMPLWDIEALYRIGNTGLELRGDFAIWFIDQPENLIANNNASLTDDVGDQMYGWYLEAAYHFWPDAWRGGRGANMDLVPFFRFTQIRSQSGLSGASTALTDGTANKDFITVGLSYFLNEHFVVKGDWRHNLKGSTATENNPANQDYFQLGVGMFF